MSQEKIDRYKEEKANRKKEIAKQKRNALIGKIAGIVVCIGIIAWIGWSGYRNYQADKEWESFMKEYQEMMATSSSATPTSSTGVNLEQSPDKVTTGETKEGETTSKKEDETTSKQEETKAEEETSAQ